MRLSTRFTLAMVIVGLLTAGAVGLLAYRNILVAALPEIYDRLETRAQLHAGNLSAHIGNAKEDLLGYTGMAAMAGFTRAHLNRGIDPVDRTTEEVWRSRLTQNFNSQLHVQSEYQQIRLIGADGRELIRVYRPDAGEVTVAATAELQDKSERDYFRQTIRLAPGDVYVSPLELNQENGVVENPHVPVIRLATPIATENGQIVGILVVIIDMRAALAELGQTALQGGDVYLINDTGDYLRHPDSNRMFGFDLGQRFRLQDDFPSLGVFVGSGALTSQEITDASGEQFIATLNPVFLVDSREVTIVETMSLNKAMAPAGSVAHATIWGGLLAATFAAFLAVVLARSLSRPLTQMSRSLSQFTGDEAVDIPIDGPGEIGVLARAFARMAEVVRSKTNALQKEVEERRRAEAALERLSEREKLFLAAMADAHDAILTTTPDSIITSWNKGAERILGYAASEVIGKPVSIIIPAAGAQKSAHHHDQLRRGERIEDVETVRIAKDGTVIDVSLTLSPVFDSAGSLAATLAILRDIRARRQADERFRLAVEASPSAMIMTDEKGAIALLNTEAERMFGYEANELIGKQIEVLIPNELRAEHLRNREVFARQPQQRTMGVGRDLFGVRKDGSRVAVQIGLNPIKTASSAMVMAAILDVTARKEVEDSLRSSEERFRSIFSAVSEGIFIVDAETGKFVEANDAGAKIYGYAPGEMIGLTVEAISSNVPPYTQDDALKWIERAASTGEVQQFDWHGKRKDGRLLWVEVSIRFARIGGRQVVLSLVRDVTDRRSMEAQLRQALKMEAIGTLAGGVAHELNNLLQPIIMMTELALMELPENSAHVEQLRRVVDAGSKASEIVQRILAFGRVDECSHDLLNVSSVAREAISFIRTILPATITLNVEIDDSVGMVRGDKTQLTQVIINFATNARDAIGAHVGTVWVALVKATLQAEIPASDGGTLKPGAYAVLTVRDTGIGMDKATMLRIFEPFFTTKGVGKGTGLGLSVTHGIITGHGGGILVDSTPGKGTRFSVYLPIETDLPLALSA